MSTDRERLLGFVGLYGLPLGMNLLLWFGLLSGFTLVSIAINGLYMFSNTVRFITSCFIGLKCHYYALYLCFVYK